MVAEVHPRADELAAFTLGTLGDDAHASIAAHVAACASCQERAAVAPGDTLIELLRCAHTRTGRQADTPMEAAAPVQTPTPPAAAAQTVTMASAAVPSAPVPWDRPEVPDAVPPELARHERYRVMRLLGAGGMGAVYEAEHRVMQRPVALKVINRAYTPSAGAVERFRREVRAAARLSHPNIVTTYDAEDAGDTHFLVMEYVEGVSLGRLVKEGGPLPVAEACAYIRQAALGLQHAHERGMVHRDVKPDNLIRCADGTVKVLDFGLAALTAERDGGLTEANVIMGTPEYMAPEQAEDARSADIRVDVYSLGCTLYYLLTAHVPYPAPTTLLKILAHREEPLPSIRAARPEVPRQLADILARTLAKKPENRYQTPGEVAEALEPLTHVAAVKTPRKRRPLLIAIAVAALFAGIVLAGGVVYRIQTDKGELVITTESADVEVVIKQGGKLVRIIDTKTDKQITLALRSGVYELELKGAPEGLKLSIDKAMLTRGETVLAKIVRKPLPGAPPEEKPDVPLQGEARLETVWKTNWDANARIHSLSFSPDGKWLVASRDYTSPGWIRVYDVESGAVRLNMAGSVAAFAPDGKHIWATGKITLRLFDAKSGTLLREFGSHRSQIMNMTLFPDGKQACTSTGQMTRHHWDLEAGKQLQEWDTSKVSPYVPTADGKRMLIYDNGRNPTRFWDLAEGKLQPPSPVTGLEGFFPDSFLPDGKHVLTVKGQKLRIHEIASGKVEREIDLGENLGGGRGIEGMVSRDGRRYCVGTADGNWFGVWDLQTSKLLGSAQPKLASFSSEVCHFVGRTLRSGL